MPNIYAFKGVKPYIHPKAFVHPQAIITGNVEIGAEVYIGPGAAIRGDWGKIIIEAGCNVQENCTLHMFPGTTVHLMEGAHVGHGAVIHGARLGPNCLIGMNSVIMDDVEIGEACIVGALSFVAAQQRFGPRQLIVGNPAKAIKTVSEAMIRWKTEGTALYRELARNGNRDIKACRPLRKPATSKANVSPLQTYKTWNKLKPKT
ncbi:MAG: transferase hexapeptide repeat family protein [Bacteroidia bacterium]